MITSGTLRARTVAPSGALLWLILLFPLATLAAEWSFTTDRDGEVGLAIRAEAPGSNWGRSGAEAVVLTLALDGRYNQDVTLFLGATSHEYRVLLGPLAAGRHRLAYRRNAHYSARHARAFQATFQAEVLDDPALAHAPILYLRPDTVGRFSDLPLLAWYEWLEEPASDSGGKNCRPGGHCVLQFSIIFTNEDGGTATDALLARWGRTLDIEYLYRWKPGEDGKPAEETYQGRDHKELRFSGKKLGEHPLLYDVTRNNNFADSGRSPLRVALWPVRADLSQHSREQLADENPWTYRVMAEELEREGKTAQVGEPRNYLYVEARVEAARAAASFAAGEVAAKGASLDVAGSFRSDRGQPDLRIERDGWVRAAIPMTKQDRLETGGWRLEAKKPMVRSPRFEASSLQPQVSSLRLEFRCHAPAKPQPDPHCTIQAVSKAFFLDQDYRPGANLLEWEGTPLRVEPGASTLIPPPKGHP